MKRLSKLKCFDGNLASLHKRILAVDGSIATVPADVAWPISLTGAVANRGGKFD